MTRKIVLLSLAAASLILNSPVLATDRLVPGQYPTIQAGINAAVNGDTVIVEPNTYTGTGNRDIDLKGKAITVRSIDPEDPCVVAATVIDCQNSGRGFYFHSGEDANSVLAGFTITGGRSYGSYYGGGINCSGSSPTIRNCNIVSNSAISGGGIKCTDSSAIIENCNVSGNRCSTVGGGISCVSGNPVIVKCRIMNNRITGMNGGYYEPSGGWVSGAGIAVAGNATIMGCTISGNIAKGGHGASEDLFAGTSAGGGGDVLGGAIGVLSDNSLIIENCEISNNRAYGGNGGSFYYTEPPGRGASGGDALGGGIYGSVASVTNCVVTNNLTDGGEGGYGTAGSGSDGPAYGGGLHCGSITIANCTVFGNSAANGGAGIKCGSATVTNSIVWGNNGQEINGSPTVSYSDVQGGYSGESNIDADPCFVSGPEGDYYLSQIAAGQAVDSPCVDAGSDMAANLGMDICTTRTDEIGDAGIVDMGYHYSMPNPADIDGDVDVDEVDYAILASQWRQAPGVPSADIAPPGGNGKVDEKDLAFLVKYWLWGK